jgi:hypothetical protein
VRFLACLAVILPSEGAGGDDQASDEHDHE